MNKYKSYGKGWHFDSYKHSLAAKGIKTKTSFVTWLKSTDLTAFDHAVKEQEQNVDDREYDMELVDMSVKEYVDIQLKRNPQLAYKDRELEKFEVPRFKKYIGEHGGLPTPVLEYDEDGNLTSWQEGYRRGKYAELEGDKTIKVWVAKKRKQSMAAKKYSIPPAWKNVKYYPDKSKAYDVTGVDEKGRIQYIYPKSVSDKTASKKFTRIDKLERDIPNIISSVKSDIKKDDNPEAEVVYTMYKTGFRPGTTKDTGADKQAYGASTLLKKHVKVSGSTVDFKFIAKKGVPVEKKVSDKLLADIMKKRKSSERLFDTSDSKLRGYFDSKTRGRYNLKDLRTLKAQQVAKEIKGSDKEISIKVAEELGNTPAVAKGSYIAPKLLNEK